MNGTDYPNMEHYAYEQPIEFNHFQLKQNWTSSILREEAAMLGEILTGYRRAPDYGTTTETQREYANPNTKSVQRLKSVEENRVGRYAYRPNDTPPHGILPSFNAKAYAEVVPRFHLPKQPH